MNVKLREVTEKWMGMQRTMLDNRLAADAFYEKELLKLVVEDYIRRNKEKVFEDVEYLVLSVGRISASLSREPKRFSTSTIPLLCSAISRPKKSKVWNWTLGFLYG